jgi:hypothetical protein
MRGTLIVRIGLAVLALLAYLAATRRAPAK